MGEMEYIAWAAMAALAGKIIYDHITGKPKCPPEARIQLQRLEKMVSRIQEETNWMREVMDNKDTDGVPTWYVRRELYQTMAALKDIGNKTNALLTHLLEEFRLIRKNGRDKL